MRRIAPLLLFSLFLAGCGGQAREEGTSAGPDSTTLAQAAYDPTMFDSVTWKTPQEAIERGQVVYRFSCLKCHGETGLGDAAFIRGGDTLVPPSFREPTWRYAQDKDGLRRAVFVGTAEGMPHWGLVPLKPRDVDAVAIYILEGMRR